MLCTFVALTVYSEVLSEAELTSLISHGTVSHKDDRQVGNTAWPVMRAWRGSSAHRVTRGVHRRTIVRTTVVGMTCAPSTGIRNASVCG